MGDWESPTGAEKPPDLPTGLSIYLPIGLPTYLLCESCKACSANLALLYSQPGLGSPDLVRLLTWQPRMYIKKAGARLQISAAIYLMNKLLLFLSIFILVHSHSFSFIFMKPRSLVSVYIAVVTSNHKSKNRLVE